MSLAKAFDTPWGLRHAHPEQNHDECLQNTPAWPSTFPLIPARQISTIGPLPPSAPPHPQPQLSEMAQSWRSLAEKCDVVDGLVEQAKEMRIIPPKSEMN